MAKFCTETSIRYIPAVSTKGLHFNAFISTVVETLLHIQNSLKILLSESNLQNQDLEMVKDDLGALKFGFALLQHATNEIEARSNKQHYTLQQEFKETQKCFEDLRNYTEQNLDYLQTEVKEIGECLETTKNDTKDMLQSLQTDVKEIGECLETTKNDTKDMLQSLQTEVKEIGECLETTKNDTKDKLEMLESSVSEISQCLRTTKNDTRDRLEMLQGDVGEIEVCVQTTKNSIENIITILTPIGTVSDHPAASCSEVLEATPESSSGLYWVRTTNNTVSQVFCDMDLICPNESEPTGWMRVSSIDMTDTNQTCPVGLTLRDNDIRRCAKDIDRNGCSSVILSVQGVEYSQVCGMAIGYQDKSPNAFFPSRSQNSIDSAYVDGISLTYDQNPRKHIWTFAIGLHKDPADNIFGQCPCTNPQTTGQTPPPEFVGNDYFCETGIDKFRTFVFHPNSPLWDGDGCTAPSTCCDFNNPPWFRKEIQSSTSENIEMRLCSDSPLRDEDINFEIFHLYIQ